MHSKGNTKHTFDLDRGWGDNYTLHVCDETGTVINKIPLDEEAVKAIELGKYLIKKSATEANSPNYISPYEAVRYLEHGPEMERFLIALRSNIARGTADANHILAWADRNAKDLLKKMEG